MTVTTHSPYGEVPVPVAHPTTLMVQQQGVQQQVVARGVPRSLESEDDGSSSSRSGTSTPPMLSEICACGCGQPIAAHQQKQLLHQQSMQQPQQLSQPQAHVFHPTMALPIGQPWHFQPMVQPPPQQPYQTYSQQFNPPVVDQRTITPPRGMVSPTPAPTPTPALAPAPTPTPAPQLAQQHQHQQPHQQQVSVPQPTHTTPQPVATSDSSIVRPVFRKIPKFGRKSPPKSDLRLVVRFKHGREGSYTTHSLMPMGTHVIIRGDWGQDVGIVVGIGYPDPTEAPQRKRSWVSRVASSEELQQWKGLLPAEESALQYLRAQCKQQGVPITVHRAEYQLDGAKLTFHYSTETPHPDFKGLLKDAFREFRCRIWLNNCYPSKGERGDLLDLSKGSIPTVNVEPSAAEQILNRNISQTAKGNQSS